MIAANELRIGNYLQGPPISIPILGMFVDGVTQITGHFIDCLERGVLRKDYQPILLTPKLLTKCGFVWVDNFMSFDLKNARMRLAFCNGSSHKMTIFQYQGPIFDEAKEIPFHFGANHPTYLHQLQNLIYVLTGKELEVNL